MKKNFTPFIVAFAILTLIAVVCFTYGKSINERLSVKDGYVMSRK